MERQLTGSDRQRFTLVDMSDRYISAVTLLLSDQLSEEECGLSELTEKH